MPAVLTIILVPNATTRSDDNNLSKLIPLMVHVGTTPFLVGLACKESRQLLEMIYPNPIQLSRGPGVSDAVYWVDWESTVVYLRATPCTILLDRFPRTTDAFDYYLEAYPKELTKSRHVVVEKSLHVLSVGYLLLRHCHGLRTLIIQGKPAGSSVIAGPHMPLTEVMAACTLPRHSRLPRQ